jgi:hypothetical protein
MASDPDEAAVGASRDEASVALHGGTGGIGPHAADSLCRTAVYVTRTHGGVGGGDREVFPYPDWVPQPLRLQCRNQICLSQLG